MATGRDYVYATLTVGHYQWVDVCWRICFDELDLIAFRSAPS